MGDELTPERKVFDPRRALYEASVLHNEGQLAEAEKRYQKILLADDCNFDALYRLGLIRVQQGRFGDAAKMFRRAIKADRRSADAHHHLGVALAGLRRHAEAIERYQHALALDPRLAEAHNNLAHSLQVLGRNQEAMGHYEQALAIKPDYPEAQNNLCVVLQTLGRPSEAIPHCLAAIAARPTYVEAHKNLGHILAGLNRQEEAAASYAKAIALRPNDVEARVGLGRALERLERLEEAVDQFKETLARAPDDVAALNGLGAAVHTLGRSEEALALHRRALALKPKDVEAHSKLGEVLLALGRTQEASTAMEKAVALSPRKAGYYWNLAYGKRFRDGDSHLAAMLRLSGRLASLNEEEQIDLHFALGKALGDLGRHEESFRHLVEGNALMRRRLPYDEGKALGRFERMRRVFTPALMHEKSGLGDPSQQPVFIIGLPRSGTTLIEQILASHPKVFGAGELYEMTRLAERVRAADGSAIPEAVAAMSGAALQQLGGDYLRAVSRLAPQAERITDKMPGNFALAGLIHLALPNARIIHACRDPRDTAFSCFSLLFARGQAFSYDLAELGRYCRAYGTLMAHWRAVLGAAMLEVAYEELVGDLEGQARRIVAYCGLDWHDACLAFHRTQRSVRTASAAQVRTPIYQSSVGRWRVHQDRLQPLLAALEDGGLENA